MASEGPAFVQISPARVPELLAFLARVFGATPAAFPPDITRWKYFDPHPFWTGSRSYAFDTPAGIAAHGCVVPVRYRAPAGLVDSMQIVDWAGSELIPGGGILVYRKCLELSGGTLLAIGGSEDTRRLIPKLKWFARRDDLRFYARPLRAWKYWNPAATAPRNLARIARNLSWQLRPMLPSSQGWRCVAKQTPEPLFTPAAGDAIRLLRTPEWFTYLMKCPGLETEFVVLENDGVAAGHALIANARGSFRIADFVVADGEAVPALAALIRHIARKKESVEVVAGSSLPGLEAVFEACGMRLRESVPIYLADPKKLLPARAPIEIAPLIGDAYALFDPAYSFRC